MLVTHFTMHCVWGEGGDGYKKAEADCITYSSHRHNTHTHTHESALSGHTDGPHEHIYR